MADDTITVNMYPSCGSCKSQSDYQGYKKYTKTWKNLCTSTTCNSKTPGTLQNNPKGVPEGELTCSKCDSDYCGFCGTEKSGSARFRLVSATESTNTEEDDTGDSASTYNDMIKDLLKPLDGEVEYRIVENRVYINKVPVPEESCELWLREGLNITDEGVTITDYNPDTPNFFVFSYGEDYSKKFVIKIPELIDRFGTKLKEINCTKKVLKWVQEDVSTSSSTDSTSTDSTSTDGTSTGGTSSSTGSSTTSSGKTSSKSSSKKKSGERYFYTHGKWVWMKKSSYSSDKKKGVKRDSQGRIKGEKYTWDSKKKKWVWHKK